MAIKKELKRYPYLDSFTLEQIAKFYLEEQELENLKKYLAQALGEIEKLRGQIESLKALRCRICDKPIRPPYTLCYKCHLDQKEARYYSEF